MKKIVLPFVLLCTCYLIAGCYSTPKEAIVIRKVIPDSLKQAAAEKLVELMKAATTQNRGEDEDWDDFVLAANKVIVEQYGVATVGISDQRDWSVFLPYQQCSPQQRQWIDEWLKESR